MKGCVQEINGSACDESKGSAIFYATLTGSLFGEGGTVPPANEQAQADHGFALTMNGDGKVSKMPKVWNASGRA